MAAAILAALNMQDLKAEASELDGCKIIKTDGWIAHLLPDGVRLLPPPKWVADLVELIENGTISNASAKKALEAWQQETLVKITNGINKLNNLGLLDNKQHLTNS